MTEEELRDYQMWMMEDLQEYLLKIVLELIYLKKDNLFLGKNKR